jgi:hypothetical protein
MNNQTTEVPQSYEVVSIRRVDPPPGAEGSTWHRYVIAFGGNDSIQGCRQGSLNVVTGAVEEIVAQLNGRHKGKHGRVHLVPTPKKTTTSSDKSN